MDKKQSSGKIWPYAIGLSILLVFIAAVATVIIANKLPVADSDTYMMGYHEVDANANKLIKARIAFDKKYKIQYITDHLSSDGSILKYKITTLSGKAVNDAKVKLVITRPNKHNYDQELENPTIENGVYSFEAVTLPVEGRWNIMAKVSIGENKRFYNLKADTRSKDAYEY